MGKFTKMALVVLYLLQLVVVFREQLVQLYKTTVETVSNETQNVIGSRQGAFRAVFEKVVKISNPDVNGTIAATAAFVTPTLIMDDGGDPGDDLHHDDDKNADRVRKQRHHFVREYYIGNLWSSIKCLSSTKERDELSNAAVRILTFA